MDNGSSVTNDQLCEELRLSNCSLITVGICMNLFGKGLLKFCDSTNVDEDERLGKFINTQDDSTEGLQKAFAIVMSILKRQSTESELAAQQAMIAAENVAAENVAAVAAAATAAAENAATEVVLATPSNRCPDCGSETS